MPSIEAYGRGLLVQELGGDLMLARGVEALAFRLRHAEGILL